jgi:hypothetical protein
MYIKITLPILMKKMEVKQTKERVTPEFGGY